MKAKLKHLEFIQAVITRLSDKSSLIKGWMISFTGVLFGFALTQNEPRILYIALVSTVLFWALDAYFIYLERAFRKLYSAVADKPNSEVDFQMNIDKSNKYSKYLSSFFSPSLSAFYLFAATSEILTFCLIEGGKNGS